MVAEKNYFSSNASHNFAKCHRPPPPPPSPHFKKVCPCAILPPLFLNFSDSHPLGGNQNLLLPPFKRKREEGGSELWGPNSHRYKQWNNMQKSDVEKLKFRRTLSKWHEVQKCSGRRRENFSCSYKQAGFIFILQHKEK